VLSGNSLCIDALGGSGCTGEPLGLVRLSEILVPAVNFTSSQEGFPFIFYPYFIPEHLTDSYKGDAIAAEFLYGFPLMRLIGILF